MKMGDVIRNFKLYNASAGSGKTFTLIKEFFVLSLSSNNLSYKNILAVTFTNKAASELKTKILDYLDGIVNNDDKAKGMKDAVIEELKIEENVLKERASRLYDSILHNYSDLRVSTIDGFVQQISRSFAKELNLPNQYKLMVDDDDLIDDLIKCINDKINKDDDYLTDILSQYIKYQVTEEKSKNLEFYLRKFISELFKENAYKKGEAFEQKIIDSKQYKEIENYLDKKISELKTSINDNIDKINSFNIDNSLADEEYASVLPSMLKKIKDDINVKPTDILNKTIKGILYEGKKWHSSKYKKAHIDDSKIQELLGYFTQIVEKHADLYLINIVRKDLYLYVLRGTLFCIINQYIEETNKVHISEFNKRISDVIGDCSVPFIYERIGEKFKHFFIDEFQDTSILQWFNFLPLLNNSMSEGKMNLLVGDAKQAIYRFRNGEVEQIIQLPKIYKNPNTPLTQECQTNFENRICKEYLKINYRSKRNIIKFNNSFFRNTRNLLENRQYRFVYENKMEQEYRKNNEYDGYVNVELIDEEKIVSEEKTKRGQSVTPTESAAIYKNAVKHSLLKNINELKDKGYKLSDITILVRTNKEGSDIAEFLTDNDIRVISSESILLKSSDKVQLIIYALKYLMNENNDIIELSLSHYQNLCKKSRPDFDVQKTFDYDINKEELFELNGKAFSLYDICCRIMKIYDINAISDVYVNYFMNLVQEWQSREDNDITEFLDYWDKKSNTFYVKAASKEDAVEIMTIHKSKGLDFKIVMCPFVGVKIPNSFKGGKKWISFKNDSKLLEDMPYLEEFILPISSALVGTKMEEHYKEEYDKESFDELNVLYVALTRPVDMLFIYSTLKGKENFFMDYFTMSTNHYYAEYNDNDEIIFKEDFCFNMEETDYSIVYSLGELSECISKDEVSIDGLVIDDSHNYKTMDWFKIDTFESDPIISGPVTMKDGYLPKERGIVVHEILSKINTFDEAEMVLDKYEKDDVIDGEFSKYLLKKFKEIENLKEIKDAYSDEAVVKNEMSILTKDGVLRPDRYAELADKVIVIDYKTGAPNAKYYKKQQDYMIALQEMGIKKKIEGYLLYIGDKVTAETVYLGQLF